MKKRVHKNQIVITTLAVLIAVAGYVTYDKKGADIKDAETVANMNQGAVSDQADKDYETGEDLDITSSKEDLADASTEDVENPGETVLTSVTSGDSDYAAKVKLNREQVRFFREFFRGAQEVELDGNGRVLIPRKMLDSIGIEGDEIVMVGQDSKIEIWGKIKYEESTMNTDEFVLLTSQIGL